MTPDLTNALFEVLGGIMLWRNVAILHKHKQVAGVGLSPSVFFFAWGIWNLPYYAYLKQPLSLVGSIFMLSAHITWLGLALYYMRRDR